ncbi:hypothetical protein LINPERPRIM_LOCUS23639 [Linum perenne]
MTSIGFEWRKTPTLMVTIKEEAAAAAAAALSFPTSIGGICS